MEKGDFVEIEFVGRIALTGEVFDLTSEEEARKNNVYDPKHKYGPVLVIIGNKMVIPGVERELEKMKVGEEREFEVKPEDGFGKRSQKLIKIMSLAKFREQKVEPVPGRHVSIDGVNAKIISVSGGRVMVDFNHPLAGKALKYRVKIVRQITEPLDKAKALLDHYGIKGYVELKDGIVKLRTQKGINNIAKNFLKKVITKWIKEVNDVVFEEEKKEGN